MDIPAADAAKARIKTLARGHLQPLRALRDRLLRGHVPPRPRPLPRSRCWWPPPTAWAPRSRWRVAAGVHDTVGYDLVAHCVNDILVQGASPLFFLDYIALGRHGSRARGADRAGPGPACAEFGCPLIGGETAEMPGTYAPGDYDLAGFIVGMVDREKALTGETVREGDAILGLPSAGLHTNGYKPGAQGPLRGMGLSVHTPGPGAGERRWARPARAAPLLPPRPGAAPRARPDPRPGPHHRRRVRRATSRGSCPTGSARRSAAAPGRYRPFSA